MSKNVKDHLFCGGLAGDAGPRKKEKKQENDLEHVWMQ